MLTRDQLRDLFPEAELLVVPAAKLPDRMVNAGLRRMLSEVGLPDAFGDLVELDPGMVAGMSTVDEIYRSESERPPPGSEGLWYLGFAGTPFLCADGVSGAAVQVHQDFGVRLLAETLETFVRLLGLIGEELECSTGNDAALGKQLKVRVVEFLGRTEPGALPDAELAWSNLLDEAIR